MACTFASSMRNRKEFLIARRPKLKSMLFLCRRYFLSVLPTMKNAWNLFENCNFCFVDCTKIAHLFSCNCNIKITKIVTVGNTVSTFKSFGSFLWDKKEESAWKNANSFWPFRQFVVPLVKAERLSTFPTKILLFSPKMAFVQNWRQHYCQITNLIKALKIDFLKGGTAV